MLNPRFGVHSRTSKPAHNFVQAPEKLIPARKYGVCSLTFCPRHQISFSSGEAHPHDWSHDSIVISVLDCGSGRGRGGRRVVKSAACRVAAGGTGGRGIIMEKGTKEEKPMVLQLLPVPPVLRTALESNFRYCALWEQEDKEKFLAEKGKQFRALVPMVQHKVDAGIISKLPNLEIVAVFGVGTDSVDASCLKPRGIPMTNTPDVLTDAVAETAISLVLATTRKIVASDRYVREGRWVKEGSYPLTPQLGDKRIGIVGLGRIGVAISTRLEAFGCTIGYWGRSAKSEYPAYKFFDKLTELAKFCDILITACSLTEGTRKIINREVLDALGPRGYVVNIARGAVIDESEIVKALVEGRIAGAGLDVFEKEPNVPKELLGLDNVVLLPHVGSATAETFAAMADVVVSNLKAHFAGKPLPDLVS